MSMARTWDTDTDAVAMNVVLLDSNTDRNETCFADTELIVSSSLACSTNRMASVLSVPTRLNSISLGRNQRTLIMIMRQERFVVSFVPDAISVLEVSETILYFFERLRCT
jgi:hypothetical protein